MIGKYERCSSCPRLILAHKIKNKKKPLCEKCETAETNKFAPKKETLTGMKPSVYIEEESFFEDDPKEIKEKDYGKISRNQTQVMSKTIMDDFG